MIMYSVMLEFFCSLRYTKNLIFLVIFGKIWIITDFLWICYKVKGHNFWVFVPIVTKCGMVMYYVMPEIFLLFEILEKFNTLILLKMFNKNCIFTDFFQYSLKEK